MRSLADEMAQEMSDARRAQMARIEHLEARNRSLSLENIGLRSQCNGYLARIRELEARLAKITPLTSLDAKECSPLSGALLNAPEDQL